MIRKHISVDQYPASKKDVQLEYKTGFRQLNNSLQ